MLEKANNNPDQACDLCYRRRIKCDAQKPRCTNCVLHDSTCTFGAASRKARARHRESGEDIGALRLQVERLESSLRRASQRIDELQGLVPRWDKASDVPAASVGLHEVQVDLVQQELPGARMELPPLQEVLSATEVYLTTLNAVLPLFHPGRLLQSINDWYAHPGRRQPPTWAAINVVLALASRRDEATLRESAAYYLHKAQTVLSEVIMGDADLLNVQILVGMVMLFQGTQDLKPATMLIAIALRLAHQLGLHTRRANHLDTSQVLERDRVFWIAYLLDRDISLRTSQPPVQREADIHLEWPSAEPEDGAGNVTGVDGGSFNFLRCRVRLARVQGEIYDFMVAMRAGTMDNYQRDEDMVRLNHMLDEWISTIPPPFRPSSVLQIGQPNLCRSFAVLYSTHLACRTQVYRAHAMASRWMQSLQSFGRTITQRGRIIPAPLPTPSLQDWEKLVDEARGFMQLFWGVERRDQAFIWMTACTYISGSVCLTANILFEPFHASVEDDLSLVNLSISLLEDLIQQTGHEPLKDLRDACEELLCYACALLPMANV
ncbi:fungal-specific transcription factor domain-containing protein [Exophiala viscosa]|uniref:fungal-specific transcription factor domain-containing protein n=1 Tax=Exophiala viscosa TaxID=2486360 RepID=UPI00218C8DB5|nr:fungal-specific transcription factor domain-containing protein [Exophiala viscosa]